MKVLFVCHRVPFPPKRGGKIRPFNIIRHLGERGHPVTVCSLARNEREREEAAGLQEHCERALVEVIPDALAWTRTALCLASRSPSSFGYFYSARLGRIIAGELVSNSYDLVFVHCSSVAPYVTPARRPVKILDYGDIDSQKWREYSRCRSFPFSAGYWLEAVKLERAEARLAREFDLCTCTTRGELASLRELAPAVPSDWFPNGVDSTYFRPAAEFDPNLIVFIGRMDYYPNQQAVLEFCRDVLPRLRAARGGLRFEIVGADPPRFIRELGRLPGVSVTGSVPDVRPHVTRAALTVAPLKIARGTQNKILESMALGVPVVCSPEASRGVDAVAGEHLLTAASPLEYAQAITRVLESSELRARLAQAGRERVLARHSWESSMNRLDQLIASVVETRSARRAAAAVVA